MSVFPAHLRGESLSSWGRPVSSEVGGGEFHVQLSSLLVRTLCVSLSPTKEWVLALLFLLALLLLALPSRVGLLRRSSGNFFHQGVFMRGYSAHGGSLASLSEVGLLSKGC